ncbi:MAG: hypothetical protein IJ143_09650 [Neisseriaceae bacterium]|nr:hypothetical protein [Neisseriaceae bacterium]
MRLFLCAILILFSFYSFAGSNGGFPVVLTKVEKGKDRNKLFLKNPKGLFYGEPGIYYNDIYYKYSNIILDIQYTKSMYFKDYIKRMGKIGKYEDYFDYVEQLDNLIGKKLQLDLEMESATAPQEKDYDIEKCTIKAKYLLNISDGLYPRTVR